MSDQKGADRLCDALHALRAEISDLENVAQQASSALSDDDVPELRQRLESGC